MYICKTDTHIYKQTDKNMNIENTKCYHYLQATQGDYMCICPTNTETDKINCS